MEKQTKQPPIKLEENFHKALKAVSKKTGVTIRAQVHFAIRAWFEKYHPDFMYLILDEEQPVFSQNHSEDAK